MTAPEQEVVTSAFRAPGAVDWRELVAEDAADEAKQEEARKAKESRSWPRPPTSIRSPLGMSY